MTGELIQNNPDITVCRERIKAAWENFIDKGEVRKGIIREEILQSWRRCWNAGVDPYTSSLPKLDTDVNELMEEKNFFISMARPFLEGLSNIIGTLGHIVFLTDENGYILDVLGRGGIWDYTTAGQTLIGHCFDEKTFGTTAPYFAVKMDTPYQMVAEEHYLAAIHLASCAAAPIHDEDGNIIGCLDITSSYESALRHPHTLAMVVATAKLIENQIRLVKEISHSYVSKRYLEAALEASSTGLIILDKINQIHHINKASENILGISSGNYDGMKIDSIFRNQNIISALNKNIQLADQEVILNNSNKCLLSLGSIFDSRLEKMGSVVVLKKVEGNRKNVRKNITLNTVYNFDNIWGESPELKKTIALARRVADTSSNIIIQGESGTGKEMLAQSIHNASKFSAGPFLGINCTAIPGNLIESELFGYEAGSFTGALKTGKPGKLELAQSGTLLLDEINGMPLDMQAKLLRVLEEKRFQRLGGSQFINLNVRIIAAANKDLTEEVEKGNFRSDLYFRLSVIEIFMPPLRERSGDIEYLTKKFVEESGLLLGKKIDSIHPAAISYLKSRSWPGNIRQLKNWIERAVTLTENNVLCVDDFPQEKSFSMTDGKTEIPAALTKAPSRMALNAIEKEAIRDAIILTSGNLSLASKKLGISRATLYRKISKYNLCLERVLS